jgi:hypothetical protein
LLVHAAAEAVDDGSLGRHEALTTVLRTLVECVRSWRRACELGLARATSGVSSLW